MKILALKTEIPTSLGWLLVGTSWGRCDNSGWPQHHKKCQEKPTAIQTWQMVQLVNSYLKQAGTRPYPGSHTSKKRKLNKRFSLVRRTNYISLFPSLGLVWVSESGSVWQKLHNSCLDVRFVWLLEVLLWSSLSSCHQLSHRAGAGWGWMETTINNLSGKQNQADYHDYYYQAKYSSQHCSVSSPVRTFTSREEGPEPISGRCHCS